MLRTEQKMQVQNVTVAVECDVCGKVIEVVENQLQEDCLMVAKVWDENSRLAEDGKKIQHKFDVCQDCYEKIIDHFDIKVQKSPVQTITLR